MKKIITILLLILSINLLSQNFNVDNKDSCKSFLCKKEWKSGNDIIKFFKNGTYTKKISQINDYRLLGKEEKGTYVFFGEPKGKWLVRGDSVNYQIDILMSAKTNVGFSSYTLHLIDYSKPKKVYGNENICPKFPCLQTDGQKDAGGYYSQNPK